MKRNFFYFYISIVLILSSITGCQQNTKKETITISKIMIKEYKDSKAEYYDIKISDEQAVNDIFEKEVFIREASKRNIEVTEDEISKAVNDSKEAYEQADDEQRKIFEDYINEMNITIEQYWMEYLPNSYVDIIKRAKIEKLLEDETTGDIMNEHPNWTSDELKQGFEDIYHNKLEEIKSGYDIVIDEN